MSKDYEFRTTVTIGDTNLLQNMYFLNFFKLQGIVREMWVKEKVQNGIESLMNGCILITKSAQCDFIKDFYLYDKILIKMQVRNIRQASAELVFKFYNEATMELHAQGTNHIVFADQNHKISRIPENFKQAGLEFSIED